MIDDTRLKKIILSDEAKNFALIREILRADRLS